MNEGIARRVRHCGSGQHDRIDGHCSARSVFRPPPGKLFGLGHCWRGAPAALEVHIFPENMRGTGEGHFDWDLRPSSKMTNANVATVTGIGKDRVLAVRYKGGEKKVLVPENAVVVAFTPSERSELKPGASVFVNSQRQPDGSLSAPRVNVGLNRQIPPM